MIKFIVNDDLNHPPHFLRQLSWELLNIIVLNLSDPVSQLMSTALIFVHPDDTLLTVRTSFKQYNIHHLAVIKDRKLAGIISVKDFKLFARGFMDDKTRAKVELFRLKTHYARDIMTKAPVTMLPTDSIADALEIFQRHDFNAIPIQNGCGPIGIITTNDIFRAIADGTLKK